MATATKNALIIAPQWIGDAVMTEPLLRHLAARGERLSVAALPWIAPVYRVMPAVSEVIELPFKHGGLQLTGRWKLARELRGKFDVAYVCPNSFKSALLPWLAGIPRRVGYTGEMRWGLLTQRLANPARGERPPMVEWYAALSQVDTRRTGLVGTGFIGAGAVGTSAVDTDPIAPSPLARAADMRPVLAAEAGVMDDALTALAAHILALPPLSPQSYVVFAPGAEYGPAKRWPAKHFAELATKIDRPVFLLGAHKEFALCQDIAAAANTHQPNHCFNLAGQTSLMQAFALIARAHRVVSNDSGLMHVAAAFGVPQVAVFGSSSPKHTPPLNPHAHVVWLREDASYQPPLSCAPCYQRSCPLGHTRCLEDVSAQRVFQWL